MAELTYYVARARATTVYCNEHNIGQWRGCHQVRT